MNDETDGETVRWMSYAELGRLRGTSAATARRMANRKHWKKLPGNDGTVRVAVPGEITVSRETVPETPGETSRETLSQAMAAFETAVSALREQLERADARADALQTKLETSSREEVVTRGELQQARQAIEALRQAEAARKARGVLARLRAAWRGK